MCKRGIVVCKQYLDSFNFMNVAMSFHNISKDLNVKPDDNCMSPLGQTISGQAHINFIVMATGPPTQWEDIIFQFHL
jgi:hypothetical protein